MAIRIVSAALAVFLFAQPSLSDPGRTELLISAERALTEQRPEEAIMLADEVLAEDPDNVPALLAKALGLTFIGRHDAAADVAGRAYDVATTDAERIQAARTASRARLRAEQYFRAEWWLRRAANLNTTPEDASGIATDYQRIQRANPLSSQVSFGIAPTDNFNNGADNAEFFLEGWEALGPLQLPPDQVALSGLEYSGDVRLSYRLSADEKQATRLEAYVYARTYTPSRSAKDSVPGIRGSDYALTLAELSLSHRRLLFPELGPSGSKVHLGRLYYAREPYYNYRKLSFSQDVRLADRATLTAEVSREWRRGIEGRQADTVIQNFSVSYLNDLANRDSLQITAELELFDTEADEASFEDYKVSFNYRFAESLFDINWAVGIGAGYRNYDEFFLSLSGREDTYVFGTASATWTGVSYFGFSPRLDLVAQRQLSDVSQYTNSSLQARVGLTSNF